MKGRIRYLNGSASVVSYLPREKVYDGDGDFHDVWECAVTKATGGRFECWTGLYPEDYLLSLPEDP